MKNLFYSLSATFIFTSLTALAAGEDKKFPKSIDLKAKYGDLVKGESANWKASENSKNKIKLKNTYFSFEYDKCLEPAGRLGDDNPKKDPVVDLEVGNKCNQEVNGVDLNGIKFFGSVGITFDTTLDSLGMYGEFLFQQKVNLNGDNGQYTVSVTDDCTHDPVVCAPRVRMEVIRLCPNRAISFKFVEAKGEPSIKRISDKNFELPQEYKDLVLSFKCGKIPVLKN